MATPLDDLDRDSREWGLSRLLVVLLLVLPVVGGVILAALRADLGTFRFLTKEDGPIEWLQVVAFLAVIPFAGSTGLRLLRAGNRVAGLLFLGLAAACVVIAGEEIAWGQRILGLETPAAIEEINDQDELTVHNIGLLLYVFNIGMLVVSLYGSLVPWVADRFAGRMPGWWRRCFVPPRALLTAFGLAAVFRIVRLTIVRHSGFTITKWGEWTELCLAVALASFAYLVWRRSRGDAATG